MTPDDLAQIAAPWIKVLGLQHWKITWKYGGANGQAHTTYLTGYEAAVVRISEDWEDIANDGIPVPLESIVIHELLELALATYREMTFESSKDRAHYIAEKFERVLFDLRAAKGGFYTKEEVQDV